MNTAARIVDFCRDNGVPVIASAALLHQITIPPDIAAHALGPIQLRGKKDPIELFALHATGAMPAGSGSRSRSAPQAPDILGDGGVKGPRRITNDAASRT
jgi:class 3 adenylate cyclase